MLELIMSYSVFTVYSYISSEGTGTAVPSALGSLRGSPRLGTVTQEFMKQSLGRDIKACFNIYL